jgi:hypothetical protein
MDDNAIETTPAENTPSSDDRASLRRQIRDLVRRSGCEPALADELVDREASLEEARAEVLDAMLARGRTSIRTTRHNDASLDNPEVRMRAIGEALYCRVDPAHQPSEAARSFVGLSIPELARGELRRSGISTTGLSADGVITRALGLHTTSDFALALADTVGRTLRATYMAAPSGVRQLARQTTAADFRARSRIMIDSSGLTLEKVNEHGEFRSGTIAEAAESYKLDSFGRIIGITRKALVNDDIGAFADLTRRLGQAAAAFEAQALVNLLISGSGAGPTMSDGKALFHADHGNLAGTGAALSETTLGAARLAQRKQTGPSGGLIAVTPKFVLVPPELETAAEKLLSAIQAAKTSDVNPFAALQLVVEPRLTSATRWYVVAAPSEVDGLEFAYLSGAEGPQVETKPGFEVDGVQLKVRLDYGAGFVDHRGWYANAGA